MPALGTVFVEVKFDTTKAELEQQRLLKATEKAANSIEASYSNLGAKADDTFQLMANKAIVSYDKIAGAAKTSVNEQMRAYGALLSQMNSINNLREKGLTEILGVRTEATIRQQMANINSYYAQIKNSGELSSRDLIAITSGRNKKLKELQMELTGAHEQSLAALQRGLLRLYASYYIFSQVIQGIVAPLKAGIDYLAKIETATLGIATSYMTGGEYIDKTTNKVIKGSAALKLAQADAKEMLEELKFANMQTSATLDQLIIAYQQTLPVAMAKGFDRNQVKEFTLAMVQAAGAIGLPMDQLGEETRSLLTGSINPRNSRIATVLGLRNEDIAEFKGNAQGLFDFLMEKLSAYRVAGIATQNTWAGLWSNTRDIFGQALGMMSQPLFDKLKADITGFISSIYTLNEETKKIEWNPKFIDTINKIKDSITEAYEQLKSFGSALLSIGSVVMPYSGTILEMLATGILVKQLGAMVAGLLEMNVASAATETIMGRIALVSKSLLPILAGFAAYKTGEWVGNKLSGSGVSEDDLKISDFTKKQKALIKEMEKQRIEYKQREQADLADTQKAAQEAQEILSRLEVKKFQDMVDTQTKFEAEYAKILYSREQMETQALDVKVAAWQNANIDILRIEEVTQEQLKQIKLRADNEQLKFAEDLYKITGDNKYRYEAEQLLQEINDAKQAEWEKVRGHDDALILRENADKEYYDKLNSLRRQDVENEKEAFAEKESYLSRFFFNAQNYAETALGNDVIQNDVIHRPGDRGFNEFHSPAIWSSSGLGWVTGEVTIATPNEEGIWAKLGRETAEAQKKAADEALQKQKEYQDEQQRLWEEQIDNNKKFNKSMREQNLTIKEWLSELNRGPLAPAQSAASWGLEYSRLKGLATTPTYNAAGEQVTATAADKNAFLSYAKQYMEFAKSYGTSENYKSIYDSIVKDVTALGDVASIFDILSGMGLGTTESDLRKVVSAFADMGITAEQLNSYLGALSSTGVVTAGVTGEVSGTLQGTHTPFQNVMNAIGQLVGENGLGSVDSFMRSLATSLKISYTPAAGAAAGTGVLADYQANNPYTPKYSTTVTQMPESTGYGGWVPTYTSWGAVNGSKWDPNVTYKIAPYVLVTTTNLATGESTFVKQRGIGGLTDGVNIAGEMGPEWVVPTYEPQRTNFLKTVGSDPETLGKAIARYLQSTDGGSSNGEIKVEANFILDGKVVQTVVAKGMKTNSDLIAATRRIMN